VWSGIDTEPVLPHVPHTANNAVGSVKSLVLCRAWPTFTRSAASVGFDTRCDSKTVSSVDASYLAQLFDMCDKHTPAVLNNELSAFVNVVNADGKHA
jgi:hypothetical protein